MARRNVPEINAGSMADIAFLLLIFFLVATTMEVDGGIPRKLPQKQPPNQKQDIKIKKRNILEIAINRNDELLLEGEKRITVDEIKDIAMEFIDNGAGDPAKNIVCDYCEHGPDGVIDDNMSVHPEKAVISLKVDRGTSYGANAAVQDQLEQAYTELRNKVALKKYGMSYEAMLALKKIKKDDEKLNERIKAVKKLYPVIISEVEPK